MEPTGREAEHLQQNDSLGLRGIDYIEFYVGNAFQAAHFYRMMFGFTPVAYASLETGSSDRASFVMQQGGIRLVLTSALSADSPVNEHVQRHGDSVKDVAFQVDDVERCFNEAISHGARSLMEPTAFEDESGVAIKATIATMGCTAHSLLQRKGYDGAFLPGYKPTAARPRPSPVGVSSIDHVAIGVGHGELERWVDFYKTVLGFHQSHQEDVATEYSAMNSKVVQSSTGEIKFPMMEPAPGKRKSQIEEYLSFHNGPGVQHVALLSDDIVSTVGALRDNSIDFLSTPQSYYETLEERVGHIDGDLEALRQLNILVDRDKWGHLMQIFTKPVQGRPTMFFEVIQRVGARGFGGGNIKALFEAIEREQTRRGTL